MSWWESIYHYCTKSETSPLFSSSACQSLSWGSTWAGTWTCTWASCSQSTSFKKAAVASSQCRVILHGCSLCQNHPSCLSAFLITVVPSVSGVFSLSSVSLKEQVTRPCSCFKSVPWAWSSKGFLFAFCCIFIFLHQYSLLSFKGNLVGHVVIVLAVEEWINRFDVFPHREVLQIWKTRQWDGDDNAHEQTKKK